MDDKPSQRSEPQFNRRSFLKGSGAALTAGAAATAGVEGEALAQPSGPKIISAAAQEITLHVNGDDKTVSVEPRVLLIDVLRNDLNLTGCKEVCDRSTCGACTVQINGKPVYACTRFAIEAVGDKIETAESLVPPDSADDFVNTICRHDGILCGYCTPGFVMAMRGFFEDHPGASEAECRKALGGNLCRCGVYDGVLKAAFRSSRFVRRSPSIPK